ncbi:hypothetical protein [Oceanitalea stevensii]|uniref:ABC transporter permease n=1 Tax=Oceanitalea stevensii TaxID=2763072 RepID=A0ABR8Z2T3_9MICO|nr:hypothetical protein [Oceanitalea stevensii]MBD8062630.1 hypothetical protein [Oceanitalea stevensii]
MSAIAAASAPAGGLRRAWAAESLKREARGVRPAVAGAVVLGLLVAVLVTGLAAVTGGTVPSEGAGLPYTVGGFGEPAGASAVARFLAPQVAVLAVFLITPSVGRDLRSRVAQVQLSTGLAPRQLVLAAWLHATRRWAALAGAATAGTVTGTAVILVARGRGLGGWLHAETVLLVGSVLAGAVVLGALVLAVSLVLVLATGSPMAAAALVLGWSVLVEPVLLVVATEPRLLPGTHLKALAWSSQHVDGGWVLTVLGALAVTAACLAVAPPALRARVCR